jgi:hypothetical protein
MNATELLNAVNSAKKPAAIGFLIILGLATITALVTAISNLLNLLIPLLMVVTKAAICAYPLFITGLILIKNQKKATPNIELLPPYSPLKQQEIIENEILITPPSVETIFNNHLKPKQITWQQQILKEIQQQAEIQEASKPTEALASPGLDTALCRDAKPLNNQLITQMICWQALSVTAKLLDQIKASEMKSIASELKIPKYRSMNKFQLLIEIVDAHEHAPAFSE